MQLTIELNIPDTQIDHILADLMDRIGDYSHRFMLENENQAAMEYVLADTDDGNRQYTITKARMLAMFPLLFTDTWPADCQRPPATSVGEFWDKWLERLEPDDVDVWGEILCFGPTRRGA